MNPTVAPPRRRKWPIILGIFGAAALLLCGGLVVIVALAGGGKGPSGAGSGGGDGAVGAVPAGMNQPARDGKFEFTVTKVQCGVPQIGDTLLSRKAQGQYCLITVTVKNVGDVARTLAATNQHAYNAAGARYDADAAAAIYLDDAGRALYEDINPGNSVVGTLVFDIPKEAKLARLELHDSALSGGVVVTLAA